MYLIKGEKLSFKFYIKIIIYILLIFCVFLYRFPPGIQYHFISDPNFLQFSYRRSYCYQSLNIINCLSRHVCLILSVNHIPCSHFQKFCSHDPALNPHTARPTQPLHSSCICLAQAFASIYHLDLYNTYTTPLIN